MSGSLRPSPTRWRRAATLMLAAGWPRPGPATATPPPPLPPPAEGFRLLLLQRSQNQGFMPGAHVFPGGVLDAADSSADWLRLFEPHHKPPRFGLGAASSRVPTFPGLQWEPGHEPAAAGDTAVLPDDVAFRICAIRETFEEAGVLLLRPRGPLAGSPRPGRCLEPPPGLEAWRARVRSDARLFLRLCADLDCTPDIWALHDWGGWLTPFLRPGGRRFDTAFYLCCLQDPPPVHPDAAEVVNCQWSSPSEAIENFTSKEIWLAPPQFYEMKRLENFASLSDLHTFCLYREIEGTERWFPIRLTAADGMLQILPGDELYLEDSKFIDSQMSTEKKIEDLMKEGKTFHRMILYDRHLYIIHATVPAKSKHLYPKNSGVNKSLL